MSWKIKHAQFIKVIVSPEQAPPERPAVAFAGRSNVGKSSLLNRLVGVKGLAKTSRTPGRTREIVFFDIDERYYFVDLPGYGYAKVAKSVHSRWGPMMAAYFRAAEGLRLTVILIDARRDPNEQDRQMIEWVAAAGIPYIFAVTKSDKLGRGELARRLREIQTQLGLPDANSLIPVSATTGSGIDDLLNVIRATLEEKGA